MKAPDRVVLSSDFSPKFLNFAFIAGYFWKKHFGVRPDLALVVEDIGLFNLDHVLQILSPHCSVHVLEAHPNYPVENQAKIARWFLASTLDSTLTTLSDLNKVYLRNTFLLSKLGECKPNTLLAIGAEPSDTSGTEGALPIQGLSGDRQTFSNLFSAVDSSGTFSKFVEHFDSPEFFGDSTNLESPISQFSDENLLKRYLTITKTTSLFNRTSSDGDAYTQCLDRSSWPSDADIRRNAGLIDRVNFPIPFLENRHKIISALEIVDPDFKFNQLPLPFSLREWRIRHVVGKFSQKLGIAR